jgi:septum formation protein
MLILASHSKTRIKLLEQAGVQFASIPPVFDERSYEAKHPLVAGSELARHLATHKALSVSQAHPLHSVIGADQTMVCDNRIMHKTETPEALRDQLITLRGKIHHLHAAVVVAKGSEEIYTQTSTVTLQMRTFTDDFLEDYIATNFAAVKHSVGGYHIEAHGIQLFDRIEGDLFTVQGLPLLPLLAFLREIGELKT